MRSTMTVDEAIDIALGIDKVPHGTRLTAQDALERIERQLATCGFNWLTGQEAQRVLREACRQSMAQTTLTIEIEYDPSVTDPKSLASAADRLLKTALSTPGILDDYGNPRFGEFFVADAGEQCQDARRRWVLYSFDMDSLLTTQVYDSYQDAVDYAELVNDILVLPLVIQGIAT